MNLITGVKFYVNKMVEESGMGMKVLLMDRDTTSIVSMVFSQSDMLAKEVYLFEKLDRRTTHESMKYLKCIIFCRPSEENIELIQKELRSPKYGQYHLYFSNFISKMDVKQLAESDEQELVRDIQEFYADYISVSGHMFSLNLRESCYHLSGSRWNPVCLSRTVQGISSVLLSLKRRPTIRYQGGSDMAKRLGEGVKQVICQDAFFDFKTSTSNGSSVTPLLLILDRRLDPLTPLLTQWNYQAMVHELLHITNNRVDLSNVPNIQKELKEVVLSPEHDDFYEKNMYLNYGEIISNIKALIDEFQVQTKGQAKVETISDMKNFIENYPQFKKMSGTVSKHMTLIGELSRLITNHNLFEVSEAEQDLACRSDHSECLKKVKRLISSDKTREIDALKLVLLYSMVYGKMGNPELLELKNLLKTRNIPDTHIKLISQMNQFTQGIASDGNNKTKLLSADNVKSITKKVIKGLKGVENVYTQHEPVIREILEDITRGRLSEGTYPYAGTVHLNERPREVIIFMIGGMTYEEGNAIREINNSVPGVQVIIGSSSVHNSSTFIDEVLEGMNSMKLPLTKTL